MFTYIENHPDELPAILSKFDETYKDLVLIRDPIYDDVGRLQRGPVDEWDRRSGIGETLVLLSVLAREQEAEQLIRIVAPDGLSDRSAECRNELRNAAVETIRRHGAAIMSRLLPFLEDLIDKTPTGEKHDNRRQGLVVLLGTLAQYIDSTDKVKGIVARLIEALSTPSQTVQESVSRCLAPLVPKIRQDAKDLVSKLQFTLFEAETYGERRGAAYGIAGLLKGMGIIALKDIDLLSAVQKNMEDKKASKHREGGLLALEILCSTIGKLFEPYILKALPALLLTFGDSDANVRKSAEDTARAMMASMTVYGTKLVLPLLLVAIDDDSWRTKCAAVSFPSNYNLDSFHPSFFRPNSLAQWPSVLHANCPPASRTLFPNSSKSSPIPRLKCKKVEKRRFNKSPKSFETPRSSESPTSSWPDFSTLPTKRVRHCRQCSTPNSSITSMLRRLR